jgi:cytochrome P450
MKQRRKLIYSIVAGNSTILVYFSMATAWALHALSQDLDLQSRLRSEVRSLRMPTGTTQANEPLPDDVYNALNALPLLDATVRETLRLYSPIGFINRVATRDDSIPLSKPYIDCYGVSLSQLW